jgi:hypothetical protein
MKTLLAIALTIACWGMYGPVLHWGQHDMSTVEGSFARLRPLVCVGLAYFVIAVAAPGIYLYLRGEQGKWTITGSFWSLAAGAAGAIGALGIVLAFTFKGRPVFVMPLVFGGAPVVNSFVTMYLTKGYGKLKPIFLAGLLLVMAGAFTVMFFRPGAGETGVESMSFTDLALVIGAIALVVANWGAYGPVLHKGQMKMAGSRLRPLICVGLAYFAVAVIVPLLYMQIQPEASAFGAHNYQGTLWSLAAGALGAIGALGIIMAFNFGGKPIYVMPLVFGGAPVVNTFFTMQTKVSAAPGPLFYAGLILVVVGAVVVLVFAPKGGPPMPEVKPKAEQPEPAVDPA